MDAAGQSVSGVREALAVTLLLLRVSSHLPQPDTLSNLSQDVVGVVIRVRGQDTQLSLSQVEAATFEGSQDFIHGGARCKHRHKTVSLTRKTCSFICFLLQYLMG